MTAITATTAAPKPPKGKPFEMEGRKVQNVPWDDSIRLRREGLYDDDGRLR